MLAHAGSARQPITQAVRRALRTEQSATVVEDLLFLETWRIERPRDLCMILRAGQILRANPDLAAEIQTELDTR